MGYGWVVVGCWNIYGTFADVEVEPEEKRIYIYICRVVIIPLQLIGLKPVFNILFFFSDFTDSHNFRIKKQTHGFLRFLFFFGGKS